MKHSSGSSVNSPYGLPLCTPRGIPGWFSQSPGISCRGDLVNRGNPRLTRGSQVLRLWEHTFSPSCGPPGFPACPPIDTAPREDARSWEIAPPAIRRSHHSYFIHMFYLPYITTILLACSKSVIIKICEIKHKKNTSPCRIGNTVDPAKRALERTRIELAALDFRPGAERALPAHRAD